MSPRLSDLFLSSQSDERLVALARAGHERAFAAIVERYRPELHALARRLCPDGRGEDVVQQAFLSAFAALRSGAEVKHLRGWLYRILRNAAYRSRAPQFAPLDGATASGETVEDVVQQRALAMSALAEVARLPARQRQAMVGTALGGLPRAELASSMGLSEGAVRQLVHRARATLRSAVTAVTPWPLARWLAAVSPDTPGTAGLAAGAGAASSGGIALKLGAVLASGTLITGVATVDLQGPRSHGAGPRAAASGQPRTSVHRAAPLELAATVVPVASHASVSHATAPVLTGGRGAGASPVRRGELRRGRHETGERPNGTRHGGSRRHDGASGSAQREGSGHGDSSTRGSGSGQFDGGGGRGEGTHGDGSGAPSGTIAELTDDHGSGGSRVGDSGQAASGSGSGSGADGSSGSSDSGSGSGGSTSTTATTTSTAMTSTTTSGSGGGSGSGDSVGTPSD